MKIRKDLYYLLASFVLILMIIGILIFQQTMELQFYSEKSRLYEDIFIKVINQRSTMPGERDYLELKAFLHLDSTDNGQYNIDNYNCQHFSWNLIANATKLGFRCGYTIIIFDGPGRHAIVAFDTIDRGIVYIEPQSDAETFPVAGNVYDRFDKRITRFSVIMWNWEDTISQK